MPTRLSNFSSCVVGLASLIASGLLIGCSGGETRVPISGQVTLDDQPLSSGRIFFVSADVDTPFQSAAEILNGAYTLSQDRGLAMGTYQVTIRPPERELSFAPDDPDAFLADEKHRDELRQSAANPYLPPAPETVTIGNTSPQTLNFSVQERK